MPYQHLICINPDCPGVKIPLTFIDWNDEQWQSGPEGARRVKQLAEIFDLHRPEEETAMAEADDTALAATDVPEQTFNPRPPPPWMRRVPFVCPYDGIKFTPEEAFGKGYRSKVNGQRLGGMLVDAVRTNLWRQPVGAAGKRDVGAEETQSDRRSESDHAEIMFYRQLAPYLRMALLDEKDDKLTFIEEKGRGRVPKLRMAHTEDLYDAVIEWGLDNPEDLVGFFVGRVTSEYTRQKRDPKTGLVMKEKTMGRWHKKRVSDLMAAMWQAWLGKMIKRHGGIDKLLAKAREGGGNLSSWFTTMKDDGIPPRAAFIGKVEQIGAAGGSKLIIKSPLRYGKESPLGTGRGGSYGKRPRIAWLEGVWEYPVKPSSGTMANIVRLENAAPVMSGTNMLKDVDRYDFYNVILDASMTGLKPGDYALCSGLFMPDHRAWYPMKRIMWLRNEFTKDEKRKNFLTMLRETADVSELDPEEFEKHMRIFRRRGLPDELDEFDRLVMERRKKQ